MKLSAKCVGVRLRVPALLNIRLYFYCASLFHKARVKSCHWLIPPFNRCSGAQRACRPTRLNSTPTSHSGAEFSNLNARLPPPWLTLYKIDHFVDTLKTRCPVYAGFLGIR